jgi:hypothetical protein
LSAADAAVVKGMLKRGDRQHDIAAFFGVNGGRVAEVASGQNFYWVEAQVSDLPPAGPYMSGKAAFEAKKALTEIRTDLKELLSRLDAELTKLG